MANTAKKTVDLSVEESAPMQVVKTIDPVVDELPVAQPEPPKPELTLEQRISVVEDLTALIEKWRKLQESFRNLQAFKIGVDGFSTQIILRDTASGADFKTSNTAVVARVLDEIRLILQSKIKEVETQIRF